MNVIVITCIVEMSRPNTHTLTHTYTPHSYTPTHNYRHGIITMGIDNNWVSRYVITGACSLKHLVYVQCWRHL